MESYKRNLEDVVGIAGENGIPIVLSTLVTNERSLEPFVSMYGEGITDAQRREADALRADGERLRTGGDPAGALAAFRKAAAIDPSYALTRYRMGQCYDQLGAVDSAHQAYQDARDHDGLRFRASGEANRIVRTFARTPHVVIADVDSVFRAGSPGGIIGRELLWEHVHPTVDGYFLLSHAWRTAMASLSFASSDVNAALRSQWPDSAIRAAVKYTQLDAEFGAQTMEKLLRRWPFPADERTSVPVPQNDIQRAAALFIAGTLRWSESHYELADAYLKQKKSADALREYEAVNAYAPEDPFPLTRMGDMYALLGKRDLAVDALIRVLEVAETPFVHMKLGALFAESPTPERALTHLSRAFDLDAHSTPHFSARQFSEATYYYSLALFRTGKTEEAKQTLAILLQNEPENARARTLWEAMRK